MWVGTVLADRHSDVKSARPCSEKGASVHVVPRPTIKKVRCYHTIYRFTDDGLTPPLPRRILDFYLRKQ